MGGDVVGELVDVLVGAGVADVLGRALQASRAAISSGADGHDEPAQAAARRRRPAVAG